MGTALYMHSYLHSAEVFFTGFFLLLFTMFQWWRDVINESIQGHHTLPVQTGLKYGMILLGKPTPYYTLTNRQIVLRFLKIISMVENLLEASKVVMTFLMHSFI